ncbi:MAG: hypothetical protein ACI4A3_14105 [Lachnospiraceae bacterium]
MPAEKENILLTAFCGSSAELLVRDTERYKTLVLPNDKLRDSEYLINFISKDKIDYVISLGQKPSLKNKVCIETTAKDGALYFNTDFDCNLLKQLLERNGIPSKISHNAGTSFCNQLYLNGLKHILQNDMDTKMVFVHIPFTKNISDFERFRAGILDAIGRIECV